MPDILGVDHVSIGTDQVNIRDQFAAWKDGSRRNDPLDVMRDIAARLPDGDVDAVAEYFAHAYPPE
jgi:cytochrome c553